MNRNERRGPGRGLLLLIPLGLLIAKGLGRRRRMLASGKHGYGHHRGLGAGAFGREAGADVPVSPKIESMLEAWHARVHASGTSAASATPTTADVATA